MPTEEDLRRAEQLGKLTGAVEHLQADVTDIKARLFGVEGKIDAVRDSLEGKIDALKDSLSSAKVWAITLYVAQAGSMLFVMAKGFKWL